MVAGSKPSMGPVRYREIRLIPLKYVRNFIFDPFLRFFFPFDSLRCVPENPSPDCRGVRITERPTSRGTTVFHKISGFIFERAADSSRLAEIFNFSHFQSMKINVALVTLES